MNIGSIFMQLLAQSGTLTPSVVKEAEKAGDAGAQALNQRLTSGLRTQGVKAFGIAAAGAFGLATKGALELEQVQANFQAQTGASAEEASRAADVINKAAGDNRLSLEEVSDAAIKVHNDLGAVGDEADMLTAKFAEYGRVTKQQAGAAVTDFDDILDAWGLTAADSVGIMDKLIASHQKYGGSIEANQKSLAAFAPQLQALGATVDDGIGLLNLFAASGLDASRATFALNTAVKNLKPGQNLDDLVRQISAIEDPTERAQAAIKVFGSRGGVALANALKPGITSLKDFEISTADAAGATDRAADVIDSTFSGRIAKALSQAQAALRGFGKDLGPAVTSIASVGTLLAGSGLFDGLGSKIGDLIGKGIAGSKAYGAALSTAFDLLPSNNVVKAAATRAGQFFGTTLGKAVGAGLVLGVADQAGRAAGNAATDLLGDQVKAAVEHGDLSKLKEARAILEERSNSLLAQPFKFVDIGGVNANLQKSMAAIDAGIASIEASNQQGGEALGDTFDRAVISGLEAGAPEVKAAVTDVAGDNIAKGMLAATTKVGEAGNKLGAEIPKSIADGALARQARIPDMIDKLADLMKHAVARPKRIARDIGFLLGDQLQKGLHDKRGAVRAEAAFVQGEAEKELARLIAQGGKVGKDAMRELRRALHDKNPEVRAAARRVKEIVNTQLEGTVAPAGRAGTKAGNAFARNLVAAVKAGVKINLVGGPSGFSTANDKDGHAAGGHEWAGVPRVVGERGSEVFVPRTNGYTLSHADAMKALSGGSNGPLIGTLVVNAGSDVSPAAAKRFGTAVMDEVSRGLREQRARGIGRR